MYSKMYDLKFQFKYISLLQLPLSYYLNLLKSESFLMLNNLAHHMEIWKPEHLPQDKPQSESNMGAVKVTIQIELPYSFRVDDKISSWRLDSQ